MKPTQGIELFANIKATFVSFFSILMFVALGVGVFLGISWAGPALQNAADTMFNEGRYHNYQIQFPYGLTDDDLNKLSEIEGVTQVEAVHQSFQTLRKDGVNNVVKVQSLGRDMDVALVVEGELPSAPNEMAFHAKSANDLGVSVGDSITFVHDADSGSNSLLLAESASSPTDGAAASQGDMHYLTSDTFKVTAIVNSADYIAKESLTYGYSNAPSGAVNALAWVPDEAFKPAAFLDAYPLVNVRSSSLDNMNAFSSEYKDASAAIEKRIAVLGDELGTDRYDNLHGKAQAKIDEAEAKIAEGKQKISDGEKQLEEGRATLDRERAAGQAKLDAGYAELQDFERQKAEGEARLNDAKMEVALGEAALATADAAKAEVSRLLGGAEADKAALDARLSSGAITQSEYNAALDARGAELTSSLQPYASQIGYTLPTVNHTNYGQGLVEARKLVDGYENMQVSYNGQTFTVREARTKLAEAQQKVNEAEATLAAGQAKLDEGWATYYAGRDELAAKTAEGEQKLADAEAQLAEARRQVADNEPKLQQAKDELAAMVKYTWSVMPRAYNAGYVEITTFSDVTNKLSVSMALLFIIVGLLVSYFAVSRIVHEQVSQIGTKKALGFRKGEITRSFLLYAGIAVFAGAIVGAIVGFFLVEGIIGATLSAMFAFGSYPGYFGWLLFLVMLLIELVLVLGATYLACRNVLKRHAVELLRGEAPPSGKTRFYEKWGLWDKLPLFIQTIVNNCVNDKRRVLSTIVGVAGCTALIVTAITLNNDVLKSYDRHYKNVYGFNAIAYVDNKVDGAASNIASALKAEGTTAEPVFLKRYLMEQPNGESGAMRIIVPLDENAFSQVYTVNAIEGGPLDLSAEGAWVSQAYRDHFGAKVGDKVVVDGGDGIKHEVPILGFYEFWLTYHEMVMGSAYFQKEFGTPVASAMLVNTGNVAVNDVKQAISGVEGYDSIVDDATYQHGNFETFSSVSSAVVAIYLLLAVLMAAIVLLNLNVMFIDEKKRELIVLMINGFSAKDAKRYISYDSIVLTVLGIIVGLIVGCLMGSITVQSIEPATGTFVKAPDSWAIVIGAVGGALLSFVMGAIALRRIPRFKLIDINKQ